MNLLNLVVQACAVLNADMSFYSIITIFSNIRDIVHSNMFTNAGIYM